MKKIKLAPLFQVVNSAAYPDWSGSLAERFIQELRTLVEAMGGRFALHFPGSFLEHLLDQAPREVAWLRESIKAGNAEVLGGAYYDALMPLWPKALQTLQLRRHRELLRKHLALHPRGWFCPSLAWEISMVESLCEQDYEYTILPDTSFAEALALPLPLAGWRTIEASGRVLRAFPCSTQISSLWSPSTSAGLIKALQGLPESDRTWLVRIPVYLTEGNNNWMDGIDVVRTLMDQSAENQLDLQWWLPSRAIDQIPPKGPISLITSLGSDLGLPHAVETCRELINRRPECNIIHKRILHTHWRAHHILGATEAQAIDALLLAVQSARYFRNLPGSVGIRSIRNRAEAHRQLIIAEKALDQLAGRGLRLEIRDFMGSGDRQIVVATKNIGFVLEHLHGGVLRTLDCRDLDYNWLVAQREDGEPACALQDHLVPLDRQECEELLTWIEDRQGALSHAYDYQVKRQSDRVQLLMTGDQDAHISGKNHTLRIAKVVGFKHDEPELQISWQITNATFNACKALFATEILGAFGPENKRKQYIQINGKRHSWTEIPGQVPQVERIELHDKGFGAKISVDSVKPCLFTMTPLLGSGLAATPDEFQGHRLVFAWELDLKGQESIAIHIRIRLDRRGILG